MGVLSLQGANPARESRERGRAHALSPIFFRKRRSVAGPINSRLVRWMAEAKSEPCNRRRRRGHFVAGLLSLRAERDMSRHGCPMEAETLAGFEPVLRTQARRLIGPRLRKVLASSDLLQETLLIAVQRFATISGRPSPQVLAWLLRSMRFRLMR